MPKLSFLHVLSVSPAILLCAAAHAQMHKVEKPDRVTRAIGVYEWTGDLTKADAARLIPVSLFIDSHFEDAGVYLARPVPFTLQTGIVYSVERTGQSIGTLDLEFARDVVTRRSADDDEPLGAWYGYGHFAPPEVPKPGKPLKASAVPSVIAGSDSPDDDKPHFIRRPETTTPSTIPSTPTSATAGVPAVDDDPDRPTLRHRDPKDEAKKKKSRESGSGVTGSGNLNDDPDRPIMRRGVPQESVVPKQLTGLPPNLHQAVAVSDAANRDPHIFTRGWESPTERAQTLTAMEALARPQIAAYLATNKLDPAPVAPAGPSFATKPAPHPSAAHTKASRTPPPPAFALTNEDLKGYTLSYGGLPTFLYTAETTVKAGGPVYLTLIAQRLPSGELQLGLTNLTDATHLDRVPWMRPIDVVDPDWSHRGQFLMELRAQSSRQFAYYRLVTAQAEQTFVTGVIE
jgi:hypothetical protein